RRLSELASEAHPLPKVQAAVDPSPSNPSKSSGTAAAPAPETDSTRKPEARSPGAPVVAKIEAPIGVDKSALAVAEPRRHRSKEHLRFVAKQACLVCGRKHCDPHHLGFMQPRALGRRVSDEYVVPLCRIHHRAVHRVTDEQVWWTQQGV